MGLKPRRSFSISIVELLDRIGDLELSRQARELIVDAEIEPRLFPGDDEWNSQFTAMWIDEPWAALDPAALNPAREHPTVVVLTRPVECPDRALELSYPAVIGSERHADQAAFLFLAPVRCRALSCEPDTTAVFAAGLWVDGLARFDGPKIHAHIDRHLSAGGVTGAAYLGAGATIEVGDPDEVIRPRRP